MTWFDVVEAAFAIFGLLCFLFLLWIAYETRKRGIPYDPYDEVQ
jgi:cbb3-type cytochrome oxidase subunit 3